MITQTILSGIRTASFEARRNFGIIAPAMQKASDPVQQLFLDKLRDYRSKSKNGALVDPTPETEKELKAELERVAKTLGGGGGDMTKFPDFKFQEPKLDPISIHESK